MKIGDFIEFKTTSGIEATGTVHLDLGHAWQIEIDESKSHPDFDRKNLKLGPMRLIVPKDEIVAAIV